MAAESCLAAMERLLVGTRDEDGRTRQLVKRLSLVDGPVESADDETNSAELPVTGIAVLATHYRDSVTADDLPEAFYQLDAAALENGPRTVGQEVLLEDIADLFGLRLEAPESEKFD